MNQLVNLVNRLVDSVNRLVASVNRLVDLVNQLRQTLIQLFIYISTRIKSSWKLEILTSLYYLH